MEGSKGGKTASTSFPALDDVFNRAGLGKELVAADVPDDTFGTSCAVSILSSDGIRGTADEAFGVSAAYFFFQGM